MWDYSFYQLTFFNVGYIEKITISTDSELSSTVIVKYMRKKIKWLFDNLDNTRFRVIIWDRKRKSATKKKMKKLVLSVWNLPEK